MRQIAEQAVGDIDRARRHAAQRDAERNARLRLLHRQPRALERRAIERDRAAKRFEREARVAERAAHVQVVAGLRARAQQGLAVRHLAEHGDADVERALGRVAADQFALVRVGEREQAARETAEQLLVDARQGQRQRERHRTRSARGQIAEVDGQRLVAQPLWRHGGQKVTAFDQHVARHRQLHAGRGGEQRAVVAHTQRGACHGAGEVFRDQIEFAE